MTRAMPPDAVLGYVGDGWPVLQLVPGSRRPPAGSNGVGDATTDPAEITRVWMATPNANIGGALGHGRIALDLDPEGGADATLKELPPLPPTRTHASGGTDGGRHLVYLAPPGTLGRKLGLGVTVRGLGSYVVLPPSVLADGGEYTVLDARPEVDTPAWLLTVLTIHTPTDGGLPLEVEVEVDRLPRHLREILAEVQGVDRSGQLHHLVAAAVEMGLEDGEVVYLARRFGPAAEKYGDRLDGEIARALGKTRSRHPHPGRPCDAAGCRNTPRWQGAATVAGAGVDLERPDFWAARPVLAHVRDFARARRASPWAVLDVVLARVVTATPPRVVLPPLVGGDVSLDLFAGLVGPSGGGKDAALRAAADAVDLGPITTAGPGSGEGLGHLFMRRARDGSLTQHTVAVLLVAPEVDTLTALGWQRRGATLLPELRKAYMGDELGFAYADPAKRLRVPAHGYRLGLVVGIQPGRAGELLGDTDAGTPQRFVWLPATDPGAPEVAPPTPAAWPWTPPRWGVASVPWAVVPGRFRLPVCSSAHQAVDRARLAGLHEQDAGLDSHAALARLKVGAVLALLDGRAEVGEADWHLAEVVLSVSDTTRARVAEVLAAQAATANRRRAEAEGARTVIVAEHVEEANLQRVARKVSRALAREGGELAHAVLRRSMTSADRPYLEEAIGRLVDAGQVTVDSTPSGHGQPGVRYRLRT